MSIAKIERMLKENRNINVEEIVISLFHIIAHHTKNRVLKRQITRFGEIVSRQFHTVLKVVLRLHALLLKKTRTFPRKFNIWKMEMV